MRKIGTTVYCYDQNGNMTKRGGSSISYTSYNLPTVINAGSNSSTISYGAFRNRSKQVAVAAGVTETTIYVAGLLEKVSRGSLIEYRHVIAGGNGAVAIHTRRSGGSPAADTIYLHRDQQGSPELITGAAGAVLVRPAFGAYGERRDGSDWSGPPSSGDLTSIANTTRHGFTGHEHLDAVGLIHMNGRVYEPVAGRFLGVDPVIQMGSSQSPNAFAYVWNNPLTLTDPSGFVVLDDVVVKAKKTGIEWSVISGLDLTLMLASDRWTYEDANGNREILEVGGGEVTLTATRIESSTGFTTQPLPSSASNRQENGEPRGNKQQCTKSDSGWSVLDSLPMFDLPSLPDGFVDFSAGLGDALLFGTGNWARDQLGINGSVDTIAGAYRAGSWASFGFGAGRLGYAAVTKGYSIAATSGAAASAFRASMRMPGAPLRDLAKYGTDAALRAAAGRTNPLVNAAGVGVAAAGAHGAIAGCP